MSGAIGLDAAEDVELGIIDLLELQMLAIAGRCNGECYSLAIAVNHYATSDGNGESN